MTDVQDQAPMRPEALALARHLEGAPLVDGHCHSIVRGWRKVGAAAPRWRRCFTEATRPDSLAGDVPAMRGYREFLRAFAGYLGDGDGAQDEPAIAAERDQRAGEDGYLPGLMANAGIATLLVDTGYGASSVLSAATLEKQAGVRVGTIVRVEQLAERVLADRRASAKPARFSNAIGQAITDALAAGAVGMKTIAAYRAGLDLPAPSVQRTRRALEDRAAQARRLDDPALVALVVRTAAEIGQARGVPLQIHTGFGDGDLHLPASDPSLLRPLLRDPGLEACPIVLLHCHPFVAQAAYLASVFPNVHLDLSLAIPLLGASGARRAVAAALELSPTSKLLAGTDGHSYPEMHWRGATLWRETLATTLGADVAEDRMTMDEATSVGGAILAGNAQRLYRL